MQRKPTMYTITCTPSRWWWVFCVHFMSLLFYVTWSYFLCPIWDLLYCSIKWKKYQFRNSFIIQTTNCRKKQIDTPNTHVYHSSLSLLGTGTPITHDRVKLTFWVPNFPFTEIIQSCKCFPRVNKNTNLHTCYKEHSYLEHYA